MYDFYCLQFEREKLGSAEDQNAMLARLAGRVCIANIAACEWSEHLHWNSSVVCFFYVLFVSLIICRVWKPMMIWMMWLSAELTDRKTNLVSKRWTEVGLFLVCYNFVLLSVYICTRLNYIIEWQLWKFAFYYRAQKKIGCFIQLPVLYWRWKNSETSDYCYRN